METFSEVNVTQGGNDLLRINILGLKRLLKKTRWRYLVKLSEFDYPVASLHFLEQHLWAAQGLNFVGLDSCYKATCSRHMGTTCEGRAYSFISTLKMYKPLSYGMKFARGSEWLALTWSFSHYLMKELDKSDSAMREIWFDALLLYQPDESFFHTALLNSPFCTKHANRHLHYIPPILPEKHQHGTQDEIGTRSPAFLTADDYEDVLREKAIRPIFFTRKLRDVPDEPTMRLCQKLDHRENQNNLTLADISWPGLQPWLVKHFAEWIALNMSKGLPNDSDASCGQDELQLLGREVWLLDDQAQRIDLRFTPESWFFSVRQWATYRLVERFAVPPSTSGAGRFGFALLAAKLGTAWLDESEKFTGHVSIVPLASASGRTPKVSLATYWSPYVPDPDLVEVLIDWGSCQTQKQMQDTHKWGAPLVFQLGCNVREGMHRVLVKLRKGDATQLVAWRDFLVFDAMEDVSLDHMRRFFDLEEVRPASKRFQKKVHGRWLMESTSNTYRIF